MKRPWNVVLTSKGWRVTCGGLLNWQINQETAGIKNILPAMRTDVILDQVGHGRRIVVDTKFNSLLTSGWYREETLRSGHIYQMYAYLRSQVGRGEFLPDHAQGLLLHPSVGKTMDETVVIQGHNIRFATVDLAASTREIRSRLLEICEPPSFSPSANA